MDDGEDPGAGLSSLRPKGGGTAPDGEEAFLHRILGKPIVTHHAHSQPVGDPADAVVQLTERVLVAACDLLDQGIVGHAPQFLRLPQPGLAPFTPLIGAAL